MNCLQRVELGNDVNLNPLLQFLMQIGVYVNTRIKRKQKKQQDMHSTVDCCYVLHVLGTGVYDDLSEVFKTLNQPDWQGLPLLVNFISLETRA